MLQILHLAARHGRWCLVAGLLAGLLLPGLAALLRPWLPELIGTLLALTAFRIGPKAALGGLLEIGEGFRLLAVYQIMLPILALGLFWAFGVAAHPLAFAITLLLAAPSVTGAPNFAMLLGHDPAPALRLLILGTAIFPATALPVLWLSPALSGGAETTDAALRLLLVIALAVGAGFAIRAWGLREMTPGRRGALDGAAAILLAVVVVGLMAALGPALRQDPLAVAGWLLAAFAVNFGLQIAAFACFGPGRATPAKSIVAGNRNIALFLVALPAEVTDPLLIFIGCYQVPMYLTPILMRRLYGDGPGEA